MSTDFEGLRQYLAIHAKRPELVSPAMELVRPLFAIADSNARYPLCRAEDLDQGEAARAISIATDKEVNMIVPTSASRRFSKRERTWMSEPVYRLGVAAEIWERLGHDLEFDLNGKIIACLWRRLRNRLGYRFTAQQELSPACTIWYALFYFLGFIVAGDPEKAERFAPIIRLLPKAIPMCENADEPGTWLVRVA